MNEESPSDIPEPESVAIAKTRVWRVRSLLLVLALTLAWGFFSPKHYEGHTLTEWLHDTGKGTPWLGVDEIILSAGPREVPRYLKMLEAEDSALQLRLIETANSLPLIEIDPFTAGQKKSAALYALKTLGPAADSAYPTLLKMLENDECHDAVPLVLASIRPSDLTGFRAAVKHPNLSIRAEAISSIGERIWEGELNLPIDELLTALDDHEPWVRGWTISALGPIAESNHQVRTAFERLAQDPDLEIRSKVQLYLERIHFKERLIERTEGVLANQIESLFSNEQQAHLKRALKALNFQALQTYREQWRSLRTPDCDPGIPWLLACVHPKNFDTLRIGLEHPNPDVRRSAMGGIWLTVVAGDIPPPVPTLLQTLENPDEQIRKIAVMTLASFAATNPVRAALERRRDDEAPDVRSAAVQILDATNPKLAPK